MDMLLKDLLRRAVDKAICDNQLLAKSDEREHTWFINGDDGPAIAPQREYLFEFPVTSGSVSLG